MFSLRRFVRFVDKDAGEEAKRADANQAARSSYYGGISAIVKFFQTKTPPVQPEETLEIIAFMEAADISKAKQLLKYRPRMGLEAGLRKMLELDPLFARGKHSAEVTSVGQPAS